MFNCSFLHGAKIGFARRLSWRGSTREHSGAHFVAGGFSINMIVFPTREWRMIFFFVRREVISKYVKNGTKVNFLCWTWSLSNVIWSLIESVDPMNSEEIELHLKRGVYLNFPGSVKFKNKIKVRELETLPKRITSSTISVTRNVTSSFIQFSSSFFF